MIDSIWSKKVPPRYPPLAGDIQAEAAVIGGGMAGVLTARLLQEAGVDTVLLEAERIGGGQTSGTTAKVTASTRATMKSTFCPIRTPVIGSS